MKTKRINLHSNKLPQTGSHRYFTHHRMYCLQNSPHSQSENNAVCETLSDTVLLSSSVGSESDSSIVAVTSFILEVIIYVHANAPEKNSISLVCHPIFTDLNNTMQQEVRGLSLLVKWKLIGKVVSVWRCFPRYQQ